MTELCNPITLWRSLTPEQQERLGVLAIATELGIQGASTDSQDVPYAEMHAMEMTKDEAEGELTDFITEHLPDAYHATGEPKRPDLNTIGIRQCTSCGCTDRYGCTPPCSWVAESLCSACTPPETDLVA